MHDLKSTQNQAYLRKRLGVREKKMNVYLTNRLLRGEVDEVLFLNNGTAAPLDYKFAKWEERLFSTYKIQLHCYALLIEENFDIRVDRGFIVYVRSKNHLEEIPITTQDIESVRLASKGILNIVQKNEYPNGTKVHKKCENCTYRNICTK
jgi:CRISPR-associated exonuclease Cas4